MTQDEMRQVLDALTDARKFVNMGFEATEDVYGVHHNDATDAVGYIKQAIAIMQAAVDAPEVEPVAWAISYDGKTPYSLWHEGNGALFDCEIKRLGGTAQKLPLFAAPQERKPLTGEQIMCHEMWRQHAGHSHREKVEITRHIEAAHGIGAKT